MKNIHIVLYGFILSLLINVTALAQDKDITLPPNWYNLDLSSDGFFGISTEKAYQELLKNRTPKERIVVAVIDGGVDIHHEDLKDLIWVNTKEIPGNGIDDDGNGYIDDVNGWNFIGSKNGNVAYDNLELTRIRRAYLPKYVSTTNLTPLDSAEQEEFNLYKRATQEFGEKYNEADRVFSIVSAINKVLDSVALINKKEVPTLDEIDRYVPDDEQEEQIIKIIKGGVKDSGGMDKFFKEMKEAYRQYSIMLKYNLNLAYDPREQLVGDDYSNSSERMYGNNDVVGPNAKHGTHVSGIIGARRDNGIGVNGIANNISIMPIRVVPEGDERDKDVANGIRYAVDNGARVINMSFGKGFKWDKKVVDSAVRYAEDKGVLLVHAAGNDNLDVDIEQNYPNKYFDTPEAIAYKKTHKKEPQKFREILGNQSPESVGSRGNIQNPRPKPISLDTAKFNLEHASNWIEVGASAYYDDASLKASFSNYGKHMVDVFAPGFMINSTIPDSKYEELDGTSMASPVVAGLAALLLEFYPQLKPYEVRDIIMKSVTKVDRKVKYTNKGGESSRIAFSELCVSGGIVNVYNALKMADKYH